MSVASTSKNGTTTKLTTTKLVDVVGTENADKAIIDIYDVFGVVSQTVQGADRLAASTSALVFLPDLFDGKPLDKSLIPTDTEEKKQKVRAFVTGPANIATNLETVLKIREEIGRRWPTVEDHVGIFGLCWGVRRIHSKLENHR
jgi:dienelactone hydrolase